MINFDLFNRSYSKHHGAQDGPSISRSAHRNDRLLKKLCETVTWLEGWIAVDPVPVDPVNAWLDVAIAERFMNAGINDIAALQAAMKKHGQHWYRRMSKVGPVAAQRLQLWLSENKLLFTENLPVIAKPNIRLMAMEVDIVPFSEPLAPTSQKQAVTILRPCARG